VIPALQLGLVSAFVVGGNGNTVGGTVAIADSAPIVGAIVTLRSSDPSATVPGQVVIPSGHTSAQFTITTTAVTAARALTISATYGSFKQVAALTVNPKGTPTLTSVTISPNRVTGGVSAAGAVTLGAAAPVGGIVVILQSGAPTTAQVSSPVIVTQGAATASFTIQTYHVASTQTVTITASAGGLIQTATLTVQ
jgi:hypothetical protein